MQVTYNLQYGDEPGVPTTYVGRTSFFLSARVPFAGTMDRIAVADLFDAQIVEQVHGGTALLVSDLHEPRRTSYPVRLREIQRVLLWCGQIQDRANPCRAMFLPNGNKSGQLA